MRTVTAALVTTMFLTWPGSADASPKRATRTGTEILFDAGAADPRVRSALLAAAAMLPEAPTRIKVIDVLELRPEARERLLAIDAFTLPDNDWIYVVGQSELLRHARSGAQIFIAALAIVLWHEMKHLAGGDERDACLAEEELWTRFVVDGVVDHPTGVSYLQGLKNRPCQADPLAVSPRTHQRPLKDIRP